MQDEKNPLEFFVAYRKGSDGKFYYMGDGKGNLRLFRTEQAINAYLDDNMPAEKRAEVVVHPVQGLIAVPEAASPSGALVPIRTLAPNSIPTAQELLRNFKRRKGL